MCVPWVVFADGSRLNWFFSDKETAQKFTSDLSPIKFTGPGQENGESFQRWRVARRLRAGGREVPFDLSQKTADNKATKVAAGGTCTPATAVEDPTQKSLQVSAKVGCLSVGLYTQQQYLAVLLRVYEARLHLKKKTKDARVKAKVGEFFVEHAKSREAQRRSIVLCKKVVHIGAQCRRFCPFPGAAAAASPLPPSEDSDPAALIRAEMDQWSCDSRRSSREVSPRLQRREAWGPMRQLGPTGNSPEPRQRVFNLRGTSNNQGRDRDLSARHGSSEDFRGVGQSSSPPGTPFSHDDPHFVKPLQEQLRQYAKYKADLEQLAKGGKLHVARRDGEEALCNNTLVRSQQVHGAWPMETPDPATSPPSYSEQEDCATLSDWSDRHMSSTGDKNASLKLAMETEEHLSSPRRTCLHGIHGRPRNSLLSGHSIPLDAEFWKHHEKPPIPELLRQARSRAAGVTTLRMHHHHRGLPWHWKTSGNADNGQAEEASNASQGHLTSQSSLVESEKPNSGPNPAGEEPLWLSDCVGDWTLRDEPDGEASSRAGGRNTPVGHDCCFGTAGAPLNLLLFEDNDSSKKGTTQNKRQTKLRRSGADRRGDCAKKLDQMSLSLRLQPELKSTEAQLCVQSLHAFPTANLLCCLTDSALCLKSLWNEESIRSRCLIACLLGDMRSQKAAQTAGLNLQASGESEVKDAPKRRFTLNRRLSQQQRDGRYSSRESESNNETSSCSSDSAPIGAPLRGFTRLRKQAKTTFSRRGVPESLSEGGDDLMSGTVPTEGLRRTSRSISGGRRRRRSQVNSLKDKTRSPEASRCRNNQAAGVIGGGPTSIAGGLGDDAASESTDRSQVQQQQQKQRQWEQTELSPEAATGPAIERRGQQAHAQTGISVSVEVVLQDVTCNLLTDDVAATIGAEDVDMPEAVGTAGAAGGCDTERTTVQPTYVSSPEHQEKQQTLRSRQNIGQKAAVSGSTSRRSTSSCNRDLGSTTSTASTDEGAEEGDAGLAFPPYPVLFSPDVCVPRGAPALGDGLLGDSSLRRAVVADFAALGVRLEAVMRVTYTSVPTGNSSCSRRREELKDTLRVGLWRLEATLVRNCTWTLASAVLFDANFGAECLRLLPVKRKRVAAGPARGGGSKTSAWRSAAPAESEVPYWRTSRLNAVAEDATDDEGDTPGALRRALWAAESGGDNRVGETQTRRNPKPHDLSPWGQQRGATGGMGLAEGYVSADGSLQATRYERKGRGAACEGLQEETREGGSPRGLARRRDSCADGDNMRRRFSVNVPRRLPSSGSSSLFRWVFGSKNIQNNALATASSPVGSSPQMGFHMQPAADLRVPGLAELDSSVDRRDTAPEPKNYTDGEMYFGGYQPDVGEQVRPKQQPAAAAAGTSPARWGGSTAGWTRNLLRTRRSISTLNSGDPGRPPCSPPKGRDAVLRDNIEGEGAIAPRPLQSPSARQISRRSSGRLVTSQSPQPVNNLATLRSVRAFSAMPRWEQRVCSVSR